ncbi:TWiK family of potassium channels protein 9-like [Lingula anatina]|uniref:TWiK family of potassium channels protein 9-like n=1 Tax=Lingula anatina TaxID=7574 RepID=A0A1S3K4F6_LINAN|nr:TWiK family of potassium channels protein 9-like [Lingula anatina]|eukprot:XP_013417299.1 TWiK family of potassium channels protein 9-like [Lingula anatina]
MEKPCSTRTNTLVKVGTRRSRWCSTCLACLPSPGKIFSSVPAYLCYNLIVIALAAVAISHIENSGRDSVIPNYNTTEMRHKLVVLSCGNETTCIDIITMYLANHTKGEYIHDAILDYEMKLTKAFEAGYRLGASGQWEPPPTWSFWSGIYFVATVVSTIGYGNIAPKTVWGRVMTMFTAIIGIPLTLVLLAKVADRVCAALHKLYKLTNKIHCCIPKCRREKPRKKPRNQPKDRVIQTTSRYGQTTSMQLVDVISEEDQVWEPRTTRSDCNAGNVQSISCVSVRTQTEKIKKRKTYIPVYWAVTILFLHLLLGTILFSLCEPWTYFESFYFSFITITTIGLGDIVPSITNELPILVARDCYIILGLVVMSMAVNVIAMKIHKGEDYGDSDDDDEEEEDSGHSKDDDPR